MYMVEHGKYTKIGACLTSTGLLNQRIDFSLLKDRSNTKWNIFGLICDRVHWRQHTTLSIWALVVSKRIRKSCHHLKETQKGQAGLGLNHHSRHKKQGLTHWVICQPTKWCFFSVFRTHEGFFWVDIHEYFCSVDCPRARNLNSKHLSDILLAMSHMKTKHFQFCQVADVGDDAPQHVSMRHHEHVLALIETRLHRGSKESEASVHCVLQTWEQQC